MGPIRRARAVAVAVLAFASGCGGSEDAATSDDAVDASSPDDTGRRAPDEGSSVSGGAEGSSPSSPSGDAGTDAAAADTGTDATPGKHDAGPAYPVPPATHVITAEQASGKVMVFDFAVTDWSKPNAVVWSWTPPNGSYSNLSDVKYSKDGKRLLVAASGGAIAVVDIATKALLLQAMPGGNTHAIEELPDGNVVSASSTGGYLKLYSKGGAALQTVDLADAHGVYWDAARKRLWADGDTVVRAFTYTGGALQSAGSWTLPNGDSSAHDLFPVPYSNALFVSGGSGVFLFDRVTLTFGPYTSGPKRTGIKAVGQNPGSSAVCLIKATNAPGPQPRSWSTDTVIFDQPGSTPATVTRVRPGAQLYKARWAAPTP